MASHIERRKFLATLGGPAVVAWPLAARAQQPAMPVIGFLSGLQVPVHLIAAFRQGLGEVGYVEGQNITFDHRRAGGDYDRFRIIADELARRQVAVIFATGGTAAALAAKSATSSTPIVLIVALAMVGRRRGEWWQT
jgi:putative ABC transport system substrate-binding protein